jgi:hypothetical protein
MIDFGCSFQPAEGLLLDTKSLTELGVDEAGVCKSVDKPKYIIVEINVQRVAQVSRKTEMVEL